MHMFFSQTVPHSCAEHRNDPIVALAYPPLASPTAAQRAAWDRLWTRLLQATEACHDNRAHARWTHRQVSAAR